MSLKAAGRLTVVLAIVAGLGAAAAGSEYGGNVRVGFVLVDDEGNRGVNQPTYNLYEGLSLSLEKFRYQFDNGTRVFGTLKNLTLNNRNLYAGISRPGVYGVTVRNDQYRRTYSFEGDRFTRRRRGGAAFWVEPHRYVRLFGGIDRICRKGDLVELAAASGVPAARGIDYVQTQFNAGFRFRQGRRMAQFEYRGSDFNDDTNATNDRLSKRLRVTAAAPVPSYENVLLNVGFQHYRKEITERQDTLTANTIWGGARFYYGEGYSLRYSFAFDRARRTGDLSATDNISHAVYAGKVWPRQGGFSAGYRVAVNDDVRDEISTNGYSFSGWYNVLPELTVKAGYGAQSRNVEEGRTLTGDEDFSRYRGSLRYRFEYGTAQVQVENRKTQNDDIGSSAGFIRAASQLTLVWSRYGQLQAAYMYYDGECENAGGKFSFSEHVIDGEVLSTWYRHLQGGIGGTYLRSRQDLDVESYSVRFTARFTFAGDHKLEVIYSAFNFDDLADPSPVYTQYYTANVVEVNLIKEL
ncbi:MAG TPA: hypothetical protein VMY05_00750 [Acidobacteriota bacterium]|nr:hypothetical protein [Acidobacteriota bacterium]